MFQMIPTYPPSKSLKWHAPCFSLPTVAAHLQTIMQPTSTPAPLFYVVSDFTVTDVVGATFCLQCLVWGAGASNGCHIGD